MYMIIPYSSLFMNKQYMIGPILVQLKFSLVSKTMYNPFFFFFVKL